jgi:ATP-dependent helicase/nuclease subunit B
MKTVLGPFHPYLENALVAEIRRHKMENALLPVLLLVPSDSLRRRLKICLATENCLSLLNVYLMTFHQLYLRLWEKSGLQSASLLVDDVILQEALGDWIRKGGSTTAPFLLVAEKAGGCSALWQTLRDLKDGAVNPANLASALNEGLFETRDKETLASLLELYDGFIKRCKQWGFYDYADFVSAAAQQMSSSTFLKQFERILYYGFYDLTQVQLDFFSAVARDYPTTLFFPLMRGQPAWQFAQKFYERHIQGLATEEQFLCGSRENASSFLFADEIGSLTSDTGCRPNCALMSCSGPRDEILTVAKEIVRLNQDEGLALSEIGVVARTLEPYTDWLKEVFRDHRIPIFTSAEETLLQSPLAKAVILLLNLAGKDYLRSYFIDLVSSPYFNLDILTARAVTPRPDVWDVLTRRLGITKGADEWKRLRRYLDRDLEFDEGEEATDEIIKVKVTSEQIGILWRLFVVLHEDLSCLPAEASWGQYIESWKNLLQKYLSLSETETAKANSPDSEVKRAIFETLTGLATLDAINRNVSLLQFVQTLQRWLEGKAIPLSDRNINGVTVSDAMAARGSRFRALFIIGLNQGLFPRTIREDAFLRDRTRRVMETVLGYKVSEKLAAFDEERLLFTLLVGAATERLYCLYQRSDEAGAAMEPSWYLAELSRTFSVKAVSIPRSVNAKKDFEPFRHSQLLLPEELAIRLSLEGQNLEPLLVHFPATASLYRRGDKLLEFVEDANGRLSEYDGLTGNLAEYWKHFSQDGLAPTTLERYARCPFQFFALNVLGLWPIERPEEQSVVSPAELGQLVHRILKCFFQELIHRGYFSQSQVSINPEGLLEATAQKVFHDYEFQHPTGYPLVWEIFQGLILDLLKPIITRDLRELSQSGRQPVALETELSGKFPAGWPPPASSLTLRGTLDRIDFDPSANRFRVIDYKFKSGRKPSPADTNLLRAALRGERLQPPVYVLLARKFAQEQKKKAAAIEAAFYFLAPHWGEEPFSERTFSADSWEGPMGQSLKETISVLINGIYQGHYFIHPGRACEHCDVTQVCRKDHRPTAWRTENDPLTAPHYELAKKTVPRGENE